MPLVSHLSATFTFNSKGQTLTVEQGSPADLRARAKNVLVCSQGFREDLPEFGIPQVLFRNPPLDLASVQEAVTRWANIDASISEHATALEQATRELTVTVSP